MHSTSDQILLLLKSKGPAQTKAIAEAMGVTRQAARLQMEKLHAEGWVDHVTERMGVGRPRRSWSLSAKGDERFPNTHAQLTVELLEAVRGEFGEEGLDRLVRRREQATELGYRKALGDADTLEQRLERLAAVRAAEGYMAEWSRTPEGAYLLIENHCPICAAAAACQGFCRSELALFRAMLAPAQVERSDHILAGARRCAYLVTPWTSSPSNT
ncbi:transcriptional regulator [Phenylobacterium sp. Root77]|jgi:predicted ArsR family transcriptional regulator|uniref:helix-turn-helix transcriptional regulator n=1 Tax=unclassified Phenylobacterium TaxID=2640670 RepID=UPI0006F2A6ED|nr:MULTISPECIES: metalloregulator ArsR/SmtB family transcription factor [unclassified Phenylobacterium]KQW70573.1 transcriptional regulator [Phenylobacterium sp. Root1277]KQW91007.1 transcriptional regulator [Phenylobacterium sp. Root1290]KRC39361.1 transcriptional regulator [Phenylobacterium sp. Root77]